MGVDGHRLGISAFAIGVWLGLASPSAPAQEFGGPGPSLGGFGASTAVAMPGAGVGGPMIIPYGGTFEGFMPGRMGGGSTPSFGTRPIAPMRTGRRSFSLSPPTGGMSGISGRRVGAGGSSSLGGGTGSLGGMRRMSGAAGTGVMPPRIGYPFRQPPSLLAPSTIGSGMSM